VSGTYVQYPATRLNNNSVGVTGRCNDSAFGGDNAGAFGMIYVYVYDAYNTNIKWRNQVRIFSTSYHTAFNAPVIHAWGFGAPSGVGLDIGTGCNRLHAIGPYVLQTFTTLPRAVDPTGHSGFYDTLVPWSGSYANLKITMQAAWSDSVTRQLNLTQARQVTLPALPPLGATPRRAALLQYHTYAPEGPFESYTHNPAFRYAF
jgi:hypothetical protein